MNADWYQHRTRDTAQYPSGETVPPGLGYLGLGLAGESGEVADVIKKALRDNGGSFSQKRIDSIEKELGDVLWYVAQIADRCQIPLSRVMSRNIEKLASRKVRGVIGGSGDER